MGGEQKPIGQILKEMELVSESMIQEALAFQHTQGGVLGEILVRLGYVAPEEVLLALAAQTGAEVVDLSEIPSVLVKARIEFLEPAPAAMADEMATSAPAARLLDRILSTALRAEATELRFHVELGRLEIGYRVDGELHRLDPPSLALAAPMLARLRLLMGFPRHEQATVRFSGRRYRFDRIHDGDVLVLRISADAGPGC